MNKHVNVRLLKRQEYYLKKGLFFLGLMFLLFLAFVPVGLDVKLPTTTVYADDAFKPSEVEVKYKSLLGFKYKTKNAYISIEGLVINVKAGLFEKVVVRDVGKVASDYEVKMSGKLYAGQPVDASLMSVVAVYDDGKKIPVKDFSISSQPVSMKDKHTVRILTPGGDTTYTGDVIKPSSLELAYDPSAAIGDTFSKGSLKLRLIYPDKTSYLTDDFTVDEAPDVLTGETNVSVSSDYGTLSAKIRPQNKQRVLLEYNRKLYVGDSISKKDVKAYMILPNGEREIVEDIKIPDIGGIKTKTILNIDTSVGKGYLHLNPIKIKSAKVDAGLGLTAGTTLNVNKLFITYADGHVRKVSGTDKNLKIYYPSGSLNDGKTVVWYSYKDMYSTFEVKAMPTSILNLRQRGGPSNIKYSLTENEMKEIAAYAEKDSVSDKMTGYNVSLMVNKYELDNPSGEKTGKALLEYIKTSNYFEKPSTINSSENANFIVADILVNGYRHLAPYIDTRVNFSDIVYTSMSQASEDITEMKTNNITFRYSKNINGDVIYGYTVDSYKKIMKKEPLAVKKDELKKPEKEDNEDSNSVNNNINNNHNNNNNIDDNHNKPNHNDSTNSDSENDDSDVDVDVNVDENGNVSDNSSNNNEDSNEDNNDVIVE